MNLTTAAGKLNEAAPQGERLIYANPLEEAMLKSMGGSGKPASGGVPSYKKGDVDIPPAPTQQPYGESMREALESQIALAPRMYEAEASQQYGRPAYAQMESDIMRQSLLGREGRGGGLIDLIGTPARHFTTGRVGPEGVMEQARYPGYTRGGQFGGLAQYGADISEYGAQRQRAADIRDVGMMGREATRALREADPFSSMMLGDMSGLAREELAGPAQGQYSGLLGMMGEQAQEGLAAGSDLSARERRNAEQEARQAMEARGRQLDPMAAVAELENLERARMARRSERRGYAGQVMQSEDARREAARRYAQQTMGASRAMSADPFMAILGRPSGMGQQIAQAGLGAGQAGLGAGPGVVFNPEAGLSYMLGQQGQQMGLQAAQAGASARRGAGMMGMAGNILGGMATGGTGFFCWIAREVYGESNPKWMQFREWMLNHAPIWFRDWYLLNGEAVAESIRDKPEVKARIKIFMDSKLEA